MLKDDLITKLGDEGNTGEEILENIDPNNKVKVNKDEVCILLEKLLQEIEAIPGT